MPFITPTVIMGTIAATAAVSTAMQISAQQSAKKRARSLAQVAERARKAGLKGIEALAIKAEGLPEKAKAQAAAIAAGRRRRRTTLATGPRGLLEEPTVMRPTLLGA